MPHSKNATNILWGIVWGIVLLVALPECRDALLRNLVNLNLTACWSPDSMRADLACAELQAWNQSEQSGGRSILTPVLAGDATAQIRWLYLRQEWSELIEDYRQVGMEPHNPLQTYFVGQALYNAGQQAEATSVWQHYPSIARRLSLDCSAQINAQRWSTALELCQLAVAVDPSLGLAHAELGRVYTYGYRNLAQAVAEYQRAKYLGGATAVTWQAWAHTLDMMGRAVEGAALLDAHQIDSALADAIRGNALRQQGRLAEAVQMYQRALTQESRNLWFYHGLAVTYLEMGDRQNAITTWQQVLSLDPSFEPALRGISSLEGK